MSLKHENGDLAEKHATDAAPVYEPDTLEGDPEHLVEGTENKLHQDLKGRHMQMIAMQVQHTEPSSVY